MYIISTIITNMHEYSFKTLFSFFFTDLVDCRKLFVDRAA